MFDIFGVGEGADCIEETVFEIEVNANKVGLLAPGPMSIHFSPSRVKFVKEVHQLDDSSFDSACDQNIYVTNFRMAPDERTNI